MTTPVDGEGHQPALSGGATRRPGHELGAARERAGLSTQEMASRLHLSRDHLEALERDDYTHLPAATFVRGYLRAYAREVGMDGDQLVGEFDAACGHPDAPELVISPGVEDPAKTSGPLVAALILVAAIVIGALAWWFQQGAVLPPATDSGMSEPAQETDAAAASPTESAPESGAGALDGQSTAGDGGAPPADEDAPGNATDTVASGIAAPDEFAATDDTTATGTTAADASTQVNEPEGAAVASEPELAAIDEQDAAEDVTESQSGDPLATSDAGRAASDAAETGPNRLEIRVEGESWLEIYDSRGRRLAYTLYSGSAPVVVNGWAPFDVYLGNAPDVTVEFGETAIDPSAFVRSDNTAGFLVDAGGARSR